MRSEFTTLLAAAMLTASCASNSGVDFEVRLLTDLIPGVDFDVVEVTIDEAHEARADVRPGTFVFTAGSPVANYGDAPSGQRRVRVALLWRGAEAVHQEQLVQIVDDGSVTIIITRSCLTVDCPGGACLGGECVDQRCTPEASEHCPSDQCTDAAACGDSPRSCLEPTCRDGVCLMIDEGTCGEDNYCDVVRGCRPRDTMSDGGVRDGGVSDSGTDVGVLDAGTPDVGTPDAGPAPCTPVCTGFDFCDDGTCVTATDCLTGDECSGTFTCRNRLCVDPEVDVDGDGVPAGEDCDELRPEAYPGATELCNLLDEDCDEAIDEGNVGALCAGIGGECMAGTCGCPDGQLDLDGIPETGCECAIDPVVGPAGGSCAMPFALGQLNDNGETTTVSGNALPAGREVWYSVVARDLADTSCDNFHFRAQFTENPADAYVFEVRRDACGASACAEGAMGSTDYSWSTDFRATIAGRLAGQCPCTAAGASRIATRSVCEDDTATYYVRVWRRDGAVDACDAYTIEFSNGVYDTP